MIFQILEERTVKVLALLGVLAFLGMALMPITTGDASFVLYKAGYANSAGWEAAQATAASWGLIGGGVAVFNPAVGGSILIGAGIGLF